MWNPPNEYRRKTSWLPHEDKALITVWGLTAIEEICETFMCGPLDIINRARQMNIMPAEHTYLTSQDIDWMVRLFETGSSDADVAEKFCLPDHNFKYIIPRDGALSSVRREVQDYYARINEDQLDMFKDNDE